jgi:hypothetical protein
LEGPCIHYRNFTVRITTQGEPCNNYREWVCSAVIQKGQKKLHGVGFCVNVVDLSSL